MNDTINKEIQAITQRLREVIEQSHKSYADLEKLTGIPKSTIQRYATGQFKRIPIDNIQLIAKALNASDRYIMGWETPSEDLIPASGLVKLYDGIPAGAPAFLDEYVVDHIATTLPHPEDYAAIIVHGESMINAGIPNGCTVMIKRQPCAENGQIVACRVNGDAVTLKRFSQQGDIVVLSPENPAFTPIIVPASDFENGSAQILGVLKQVIINY